MWEKVKKMKQIATPVGLNFMNSLAILFVGLKLTHFIDWSWWRVLLPLYWLFAAWVLSFVFVLVVEAVLWLAGRFLK
jgi:hypothetical protein